MDKRLKETDTSHPYHITKSTKKYSNSKNSTKPSNTHLRKIKKNTNKKSQKWKGAHLAAKICFNQTLHIFDDGLPSLLRNHCRLNPTDYLMGRLLRSLPALGGYRRRMRVRWQLGRWCQLGLFCQLSVLRQHHLQIAHALATYKTRKANLKSLKTQGPKVRQWITKPCENLSKSS